MSVLRGSMALALLATGACTGKSTAPAAHLWTLFDFAAAAAAGGTVAGAPAARFVTPPGAPLELLSPPWAANASLQSMNASGIPLAPAITERQAGAYVTTELWTGYPGVWTQPEYVLVTGFDASGPKRLMGAAQIFSVGPKSGFYSPFWQVYYVTVPDGTDPNKYTRVKQLLDEHLPVTAGPGRLCVLAPDELVLASPEGAPAPQVPLYGGDVTRPFTGSAWADGERVWLIDFGAGRFTWDEYGLVQPTKLYAFSVRAADGTVTPTDLPHVLGAGPGPNGAALWSVQAALLPKGAGAFAPASKAALAALWNSQGVPTPPVADKVAARANAGQYVGRVALNPACFLTTPSLGDEADTCRWLDSADAVAALPQGTIFDTGMLATCPLVSLAGKAVGP